MAFAWPHHNGSNDHLAEHCHDELCRRLPCEMFKAGYRKGLADGESRGHARGRAEGYQDGLSDGYRQGLGDCPGG